MSARRRDSSLDRADVISNGSMCLYRNDREHPFGDRDEHVLTESWDMPSDMPDAYTRLEAAERKLVRRVMRVFDDLVLQELYARQTLLEENPRIFEDSVMRALAILRHARLLSPWELFDLLSPLRLAATFGLISGITRGEIVSLMTAQTKKPELPPPRTVADEQRRDSRDAALADRTNKRFARVQFALP